MKTFTEGSGSLRSLAEQLLKLPYRDLQRLAQAIDHHTGAGTSTGETILAACDQVIAELKAETPDRPSGPTPRGATALEDLGRRAR